MDAVKGGCAYDTSISGFPAVLQMALVTALHTASFKGHW